MFKKKKVKVKCEKCKSIEVCSLEISYFSLSLNKFIKRWLCPLCIKALDIEAELEEIKEKKEEEKETKNWIKKRDKLIKEEKKNGN